uniref:FTH domain-containing protein n=1 Tax=Caenorhabditis tropicalis TaxID=1561998 RepID=A0A1I7TAH5_9PELO
MDNELVLNHNGSDKTHPKFEIHLTKSQGDSPFHLIERVNYNGDLHKAEESLIKFMFSNRRHIVVVKRLSINKKSSIRLPSDLKMRIKNLNIVGNVTTNTKLMKSVVDKSNLPLESLRIFIDCDNKPELDYEFIGIFKRFFLSLNNKNGWIPAIQSLQNQIVNVNSVSGRYFKGEQFHLLIKSWIETEKHIGTCFTFHTHLKEKSDATKILNFVRDRFDEATDGEKCVNIPMSSSAVIKLSFFSSDKSYFLPFKMAVVPVEFTSNQDQHTV